MAAKIEKSTKWLEQTDDAERSSLPSIHNEDREKIEDANANTEYPAFWRVSLITVGLCLSVFCMSLDNTIIATAIPKITNDFNSLDDVGWYGSAYLLTTCAFQLFFGKLFTFLSVKWVYLSALLIFEVGSIVCGAAPNSNALIVGRAVAGIGAAGIFAGSFLITALCVPLKQRPLFTSLVGSMYGVASITGPLIGGAFTDRVTWRWCFYINLPIGAATALFVGLFFNINRSSTNENKAQESHFTLWHRFRQLDPLGLLFFASSIICVLFALQWGGTTYSWSNWRIILLFVLFGILMAAFITVQPLQGSNATIPTIVICQRTVIASVMFASMMGATFFSTLYFLPLWFQAVKGVSAEQSGINNLPFLLSMIILSVASGGVVTALGYVNPFCFASTICMAIGAALCSTFDPSTGSPKWIGYQILLGAGVGMGFQQPVIAVQTVLPIDQVPIGTALVIFAQGFGGALFLSACQNVFQNQLVERINAVIPGIAAGKLLAAGAGNWRGMVSPDDVSSVVVAYNDAITKTFYISLATACASLIGAGLLEWKSVKGNKTQAAGN